MTDKTNAWPTEVERRHGSTTSSHSTTGACDYFDGEAWRQERRGVWTDPTISDFIHMAELFL